MKILCLILGHDSQWVKRIQPNLKVTKRDLTCSRCGTVTDTLTWPNLTYREDEER